MKKTSTLIYHGSKLIHSYDSNYPEPTIGDTVCVEDEMYKVTGRHFGIVDDTYFIELKVERV